MSDHPMQPWCHDDQVIVPKDVLQKAYDLLEEVEDRWDVESETYTTAMIIDTILNPNTLSTGE